MIEAMEVFVRSQHEENSASFSFGGEWNEGVAFALALRRCLYEALFCGTNRVFLSDHEYFSGFFQFDIIDGQMYVQYYIINDPESMKNGMTLRSAVNSFFYSSEALGLATKSKVKSWYDMGSQIEDPKDPFTNVLQIYDDDPSAVGRLKKRKRDHQINKIGGIREDLTYRIDKFPTNTYCRIIENAKEVYPDLDLSPSVFCKMYYSRQNWWYENEYDLSAFTFSYKKRNRYYDDFFDELEINEAIQNSQFANNFPRLLASGYWNGYQDRPMHIFEDLGG
ncbi:uncharacterized protein RJT20DRAFT_128136 [Scheffersomyces xylosifermentans]|uniref:uncharacterized protein n=1 Tax=Scheffersomyces xylosifermentans TaxID=1304137 RepID=UPI00315CFF73